MGNKGQSVRCAEERIIMTNCLDIIAHSKFHVSKNYTKYISTMFENWLHGVIFLFVDIEASLMVEGKACKVTLYKAVHLVWPLPLECILYQLIY